MEQILYRLSTARSVFVFCGATALSGPGLRHYWGFAVTLRHTTLDRIPLNEWSARRGDLYLKTHRTQNRLTSVPSVVFEPAIPASERPQTHALDREVTRISSRIKYNVKFFRQFVFVNCNTGCLLRRRTQEISLFWDFTRHRMVISNWNSWTARPLKIGRIICPETSVRNCSSMLHNISKKRRPHLHRCWSLKSRKQNPNFRMLFLWTSDFSKSCYCKSVCLRHICVFHESRLPVNIFF